MLSSFGMDFALKFASEDQKNLKKRSSSQNLRLRTAINLRLRDHVYSICLAVS